MSPVVAIVGRPNVGKSTLFNRLVGSRIAIVEAWEGVTRDRVEAEVHRDGAEFTLVDTGGVGIVDRDDLSKEVETQIWTAAREADVIIFLVDARTGPTPADRDLANRLRRLERPIVLVANKVDHRGLEAHVYEFSSLGLGDALAISAVEGGGIGELVAAVRERFPESPAPGDEDGRPGPLKIALVGRRNAGKSTMVNALCGEERMIVSEVPGTTRDSVDVTFELGGRAWTVVDTAGMRKRTKIEDSVELYSQSRTRAAIAKADAVLLLLDSSGEIGEVDKKLAGLVADQCVPVVIVVSKWDLARDKGLAPADYERYVRENVTSLAFAPIAFVSGKEGINLEPTLRLAAQLHEQAGIRVGTGELNRAVERLIMDYSLPSRGGHQGKIYFASQVGVHPPRFVFMVNRPKAFPATFRRFVENFLRESFPFKEVPLALVWRERRSFFEKPEE